MRKALERFRYRAERGQAVIEAVVALPCILIFVLVALEGVCMFDAKMQAENAARTGLFAIEAADGIDSATIADIRQNPDGAGARKAEAAAKAAIVADTGWDAGAVRVDVATVGAERQKGYRHQLPAEDGSWAVDETGAPGRQSFVYSQKLQVAVEYDAPAKTPIGILAATITGGASPFESSYTVAGQAGGAIDTTTESRW